MSELKAVTREKKKANSSKMKVTEAGNKLIQFLINKRAENASRIDDKRIIVH